MSSVPPTSSSHPESWKFGFPIYHAESRPQWRSWLTANHASERGVWLCSWRSPAAGPRCPYDEVVLEALCFGWIDATVNTLDEQRGLQLITPRKPKSTWTRLNRRRVAEMETAGLMTDAGRRIVAIAQANGYWTIYDPVEDLIEPPELSTALDATPEARVAWNAFPPTARKQMLWWVISTATAETRARRVSTIVDKAGRGERALG